MKNQPEIKRFVQQTLGCTCPDEVFEEIDIDHSQTEKGRNRLLIGNRLLIHVHKFPDNTKLETRLQQALEKGVEERNSLGLNRFRLVLVTNEPESRRTEVEHIFNASIHHDDRAHVHVISESEAAAIWP